MAQYVNNADFLAAIVEMRAKKQEAEEKTFRNFSEAKPCKNLMHFIFRDRKPS